MPPKSAPFSPEVTHGCQHVDCATHMYPCSSQSRDMPFSGACHTVFFQSVNTAAAAVAAPGT